MLRKDELTTKYAINIVELEEIAKEVGTSPGKRRHKVQESSRKTFF